MTNTELQVLKQAHEILDRLTDDKSVMENKDMYACKLSEAEDSLRVLLYHIEVHGKEANANQQSHG